MYAALWRRLPGGALAKAVQSLVLFLAVVTVLFLWVFPRLTPYLPFENVTVDSPTPAPTSTGPTTAGASR